VEGEAVSNAPKSLEPDGEADTQATEQDPAAEKHAQKLRDDLTFIQEAVEATESKLFERDEALKEARANEKRLAGDLEERQQSLEAMETRLSQRDEALEETRANAERLAGDLEERQQSLEALETRLSQRDEALKEARAKAERLAGDLEERQQSLEALETRLSQRDEALKDAQAAAERLANELAERDKVAVSLRSERDKAVSDIGLAMRMQALLQSDLGDLREQYRETQAVRTAQDELLAKLTPRLQEAAQQLRQLHLAQEAEDGARLPVQSDKDKIAQTKPRAKTRRRAAAKKPLNEK
jgi:chromosome segregation ATPase